jgi:hypothetical protein
LKISLKYEYLNDIEIFIFFPFPISNHDVIRHIKNTTKELFLKMFKRPLKIIIVFGILKSP